MRISGIKILISTLFFISNLYAIELNWLHDYDKALAQAKKEKKDVYLLIGADHCRFCTLFKEKTLSNESVIKDMKKDFVLLYLSRDQHKIPVQFEKYGVPRHYFLTSDGKIIHSDQGTREVSGWYDLLDEVDLKKDVSN